MRCSMNCCGVVISLTWLEGNRVLFPSPSFLAEIYSPETATTRVGLSSTVIGTILFLFVAF